MPSVFLAFATILCASLALASDSGAAPRLRGVPSVPKGEAEDVPSVSPANPLEADAAAEAATGPPAAAEAASEAEAPSVPKGEADDVPSVSPASPLEADAAAETATGPPAAAEAASEAEAPSVPKGEAEDVPSVTPASPLQADAAAETATGPPAAAEAASEAEPVQSEDEDAEDNEDDEDVEGIEDAEDDEDVEPTKPVMIVNETELQEKREQEEGGTCCFSGESKTDTCGTCYPMSIASYKSQCSKKNKCGHCGGTWCATKCVMGAADPSNKCGTAYPTGISSDPFCSKDKANCKSCNGDWCRAGYNSNFVLVEGSHGREVPEYVPPEDETLGTCCYRGARGSEDMCSACADVAKDSTCSKKSRCAGCGGTWCPGPKCVKAFADETKPCKSAFPVNGIAKVDDFCSLNEKQCSDCKGAWCSVGNITYSDGTKYDPSHPYVPESDQRLEPEDSNEAEEEVANDPSLDDLFPGGLAGPNFR